GRKGFGHHHIRCADRAGIRDEVEGCRPTSDRVRRHSVDDGADPAGRRILDSVGVCCIFRLNEATWGGGHAGAPSRASIRLVNAATSASRADSLPPSTAPTSGINGGAGVGAAESMLTSSPIWIANASAAFADAWALIASLADSWIREMISATSVGNVYWTP